MVEVGEFNYLEKPHPTISGCWLLERLIAALCIGQKKAGVEREELLRSPDPAQRVAAYGNESRPLGFRRRRREIG